MNDKPTRNTPAIRGPRRAPAASAATAPGVPPAATPGQGGVGKASRFRGLVGYRAIAWRRDYAEIELEIGEDHTNSLGIVHGGVYMTILDAAMGHAVTWCAVPGNVRYCVTLSLTTTFLEQARGRRIVAIGRTLAIHDRIATAQAEVRDEGGTRLATAQASFRYFDGSDSVDGVPRRERR